MLAIPLAIVLWVQTVEIQSAPGGFPLATPYCFAHVFLLSSAFLHPLVRMESEYDRLL